MKNTEIIEFPGIQNVLDNIDIYKKKFLKDSLIVFRNANLTYEDQSFFHAELAKRLNYNILISPENKADKYIENHSKRRLIDVAKQDDILLGWHVEHVYYKNPIVISTWNMTKFTTNSENGKTYFVDCEKAYNEMPEHWRNFLARCKVNNPGDNSWNTISEYPVVKNHWITGNPVLRLVIKLNKDDISNLVSVDDKDPTSAEKEFFEEISVWLGDYVYNNEEARIVHKWQQGDILMVDIFKLAHAVTGGFKPEDREFIGMWGYKDPKDK